jgi:hypothetical protein
MGSAFKTTVVGLAVTLLVATMPAWADEPQAAQSEDAAAKDAAAPGQDAPAEQDEHPRMPVVAAGLGVGGVGVLAGIVLHVVAGNAASTADLLLADMRRFGMQCTSPPQNAQQERARGELLRLREEHDELANAGTLLLISGGAVLAMMGAYVLAAHAQASSGAPVRPAAVQVTPAVGAGSAGVWVQGRF